MAKSKTTIRYRDSKNGRFIKKENADRHPATTQKETIHLNLHKSKNRNLI